MILENLPTYIQEKHPQIYCVQVISQNNQIFSYDKKRYLTAKRTIRSITKSVTGSLVGICFQKGYLTSPDQPIAPFFPEIMSVSKNNYLADITLKHLLTMTSGVDCSERATHGFFKSRNWVEFFLSRPAKYRPGQKFMYSSAGSHLLSAIIEKASGQKTEILAQQALFTPLGIQAYDWPEDHQGVNHGGFGLKLSPQDLVKIGQLYMQKGNWQGQQILPVDYIEAATKQQNSGGFPEKDGYGYQWWIGKNSETAYYYAAGMGGQYIFIVPDLKLVTVITANSRRPNLSHKKIFTDLIFPELLSQ